MDRRGARRHAPAGRIEHEGARGIKLQLRGIAGLPLVDAFDEADPDAPVFRSRKGGHLDPSAVWRVAKAAAARGRVVTGKASAPVAPAAEAALPGTGHEKGAKAEPKPKLSAAKAGAKDKPKARDRDRDKDKDKASGKKGKR